MGKRKSPARTIKQRDPHGRNKQRNDQRAAVPQHFSADVRKYGEKIQAQIIGPDGRQRGEREGHAALAPGLR